ncbi:hypothetical protein [Nonomuraea zeae]|uniref:Uncharacterized protein n=1 Tax=Nonomuraea zeae TaxID=1642303 RepID=A0A5S4GFH4_9ACTN|nr:hypothetical protein [Nonomuraea zeae]TMR31244.1 hypothetical protein ETD85_26665 [Nonomuraea zeae]
MNWPTCPGCQAALPPGLPNTCHACGLLLHGPAADDFLAASNALALLDERRTELAQRRADSLERMRRASATPSPTVLFTGRRTSTGCVTCARSAG